MKIGRSSSLRVRPRRVTTPAARMQNTTIGGSHLLDITGVDEIAWVIPSPGGAAILGFGALVACRRRRLSSSMKYIQTTQHGVQRNPPCGTAIPSDRIERLETFPIWQLGRPVSKGLGPVSSPGRRHWFPRSACRAQPPVAVDINGRRSILWHASTLITCRSDLSDGCRARRSHAGTD